MAYIGKEPVRGQNRELDDISGSFNGSTTAFTMQVGGLNTSAGSVNQLFINVGGILQNPGTDFTVAASTLTFTTAPANGLDFWGIIQGDAVDINTPADNSVTTAKILNNAVDGTKIAIGSDAQGDVLYYTGTDYARLPAGTSGDFLKTQGSGANPVWATVASSDTLSFRNVIVNGAMQVSQRGTSETGINSAGKFRKAPDRFKFSVDDGTWTVSQDSSGPPGIANSYKVDCTTADASIAAGNETTLNYKAEGQDLQRFCKGTSSAKKFSLQFWVKSNKTGNYAIQMRDQNNTRHVSHLYTISSADTWEQKKIVFPADTTGAFNDDAANSLQLTWFLSVGTNKTSGTMDTSWAAVTDANIAAGQNVNLADSTSNYLNLTGVQLEAGDACTDYEYRSFADELARCQRYFWQLINYNTSSIAVASMYSASDAIWVTPYPVTMRASPAIYSNINDNTDYLIGRWYNGTGGNNGTGNLSIQRVNHNTIMVYSAGWSLPATGAFSLESNNASCYLGFDAEL